MRLNFRQGVVGHQTGGFMNLNGSSNVNLVAANRPTTVTVAHADTNYLWSEDKSVDDAWVGPFSSGTYYWLYWEFDTLTFERTFGYTTLEPVYQPVAPGYNIPTIVGVTPGGGSPAAYGSFTINQNYILPFGRVIEITGSTGNDGMYTVYASTYDSVLGKTTVQVVEPVVDTTVDGNLVLEFDTFMQPLEQTGRIWYNTSTFRCYEYTGVGWAERIRVFAGRLYNLVFSPLGMHASPDFTGTQIGNVSAIQAGRVMYDSSSNPIQRDAGTFFTTEDEFFAQASRVDALRLESNIARAKAGQNISAFSVVGWTEEGIIRTATYDMVGRGDPGDPLPPDDQTTVVGILCENLLIEETGAVIVQGVITNPDWNWLDVTRVGGPLWVNNGALVPQDPHFNDVVTFPIGRVPVARVLARDTIVFEQGLGGKGDRGPGANSTLPYDMSFFASGQISTADALLGCFPITRSVVIDSTSTEHQTFAETPATASTVFLIKQNDTEVGTVTFGAGSPALGTVSFPATVYLVAGDVLKFYAPSTPDASIADVAITLVGIATIT